MKEGQGKITEQEMKEKKEKKQGGYAGGVWEIRDYDTRGDVTQNEDVDKELEEIVLEEEIDVEIQGGEDQGDKGYGLEGSPPSDKAIQNLFEAWFLRWEEGRTWSEFFGFSGEDRKSIFFGFLDSVVRVVYVVAVINFPIILQDINAPDQNDGMPKDTEGWKPVFTFFGLVALTCYNYFIMKFTEFSKKYRSRQEASLFFERSSWSQIFSSYKDILVWLLGFLLPSIYAFYYGTQHPSSYGRITDNKWVDLVLTFVLMFPLFLGFSTAGTVILSLFLLSYLKPIWEWVLRTWNRENAVGQARESLLEAARQKFLQRFKAALRNYQLHSNRSQAFEKYLKKLKEIIETMEKLDWDYREPVFKNKFLQLLSIIFKMAEEDPAGSTSWLEPLLLFILTTLLSGGFLVFSKIQSPNTWLKSFLFLTNNINPNVTLPIYSLPAGIFAFVLYALANINLIKETSSFLLNKLLSLIRCFLQKESDTPIVIQQHRYLYLLNCLIIAVTIGFADSFFTEQIFFNWISGGSNLTAGSESTSQVQYAGEHSFLGTYLPLLVSACIYGFPIGQILTSGFKGLMSLITYFFPNEKQSEERRGEQILATGFDLFKDMKQEEFANLSRGLLNPDGPPHKDPDKEDPYEALREALHEALGNDFENVYREAYRKKGTETANDPEYAAIIKKILEKRNDGNLETGQGNSRGTLLTLAELIDLGESLQKLPVVTRDKNKQNIQDDDEEQPLLEQKPPQEPLQEPPPTSGWFSIFCKPRLPKLLSKDFCVDAKCIVS